MHLIWHRHRFVDWIHRRAWASLTILEMLSGLGWCAAHVVIVRYLDSRKQQQPAVNANWGSHTGRMDWQLFRMNIPNSLRQIQHANRQWLIDGRMAIHRHPKSSTFNLPVPTKKPREIHWFGINWRANIFAYWRSVLNEPRVTLWFPLLIQIHSPLSVYPGTKTIRAINLTDLLATTTTLHEEERIHKMLSLSFSTSILFSCRNSDAFASARVMWCIFNAVAPSFVSLPSLSWLISIWL